mgnify:CR=1 FL=1
MRDSAGSATDLHGYGQGLLGGNTFNNTASSGMGSLGTGGRITSSADVAALDALQSFTISGWMRNMSSLSGSGAVLFQDIQSATANGISLTLGNNLMQITINNSTHQSSVGAYSSALTDWVFFAVTFNGAGGANNLNFYVGSTSAPVTLVNSVTTPQTVTTNNTQIAGIGNSIFGAQNNRPFDGMLDNFRVHGSQADSSGALSLAELEGVRYLDTTILPEPSTVMLLLMGAPLWRAIRRRMAASGSIVEDAS